MAADALAALKAYGAAARVKPTPEPAAAAGDEFGSLVADAIGEAARSLKTAEASAGQAALGKADLVDVTTAVAAAEVTMETMLAIRDEVIKAYQEILRMPI